MPAVTDINNTGSAVQNDEPVKVDPIVTTTGTNTTGTTTATTDSAATDDINKDIPVDTSVTADLNETEPLTGNVITVGGGGGGGGGGWSDDENANVLTETPKKFFDKSINFMGVGLTAKDIMISLTLGAAGFWAAKRTNQQPTGLIGYTLAGMLAGITLSKLIIKKKE